MEQQLFINEGRVYRRIEGGLVDGYEEVEASASHPTVTWKGPLIPVSLLRQVNSFLSWVNRERKGEAQVRLYIHPKDKRWIAWAYPQIEMGMHTKEIEWKDCEEARQQRAALGKVKEVGTIHSHCDCGASQSGGDSSDEQNRCAGIHITVGHLSSPKYSIDARFGWIRGNIKAFHRIELADWVEIPPEFADLPVDIRSKIAEHLITSPSNEEFPEVWKTNVRDRPARESFGFGNKWSYHDLGSNLPVKWSGTPPPKIHETEIVTSPESDLRFLCQQNGIEPREALDFIGFAEDLANLARDHGITFDRIGDILEELDDMERATTQTEWTEE